MFTNGPQPVMAPFVRGRWKGYFIYGPECSPELSGKQCCFTANLIDQEDGLFNGTGIDPDQEEDPFTTLIEGHITAERILFSMENHAECFCTIFKGTWNAGTRQFSGTWRTARYPEEQQEFRGDWIMEFDEPIFLTEAEEENFQALCDSELSYDYSDDDGEVSGHRPNRIFVSLSIIFILLATALGTFVSTNGNLFVTASFVGLVFGSIISLILFVNIMKRK